MAQIEPITWFRNAHPEQGSLRVQVSAAQGIFPIPGCLLYTSPSPRDRG